MLLGTTGILAINIGGTTIHSGLGIKPGTKALGLNDKSKATFRNRLSEVIYGQILIQFWGGDISDSQKSICRSFSYDCSMKHLLVLQLCYGIYLNMNN